MLNRLLDGFFEKINTSLKENTFVKIFVSQKNGKEGDLRAIFIKRVLIKKGEKLSFTYRYKTKDIVKNYDFSEAILILKKILGVEFLRCELFTTNGNFLVIFTSKGGVKIKTSQSVILKTPSTDHDKQKSRFISTDNNIYLYKLGVLNSDFEIIPSMQDKFRQINKFLEILDSLISQVRLPNNFSVVDMGSGKGYLTFSLYDYITNYLGLPVTITGIEFREELVDLCNNIAKESNFKNLFFLTGAIKSTSLENIDILIALHACDTATDDAIYKGIISNSKIILCSPCCHKQVRKQIHVSHEFSSILKNGILEERQAEIITDGIRALIMEAYGYKTKVFEFISTEHTGKNLMITGIKTNEKVDKAKILKQIEEIKKFFGIEYHYLEKLLHQNQITGHSLVNIDVMVT